MVQQPQESQSTSYEFPFDAFNGPVNDPRSHKAVYVILTPSAKIGRKPTAITRRNGDPVGEIHWGLPGPMSLKGPRVFINGWQGSAADFLAKKREGMFKTRWCFKDAEGREFHWKDRVCYDSYGRRAAEYTRQVEHFQNLDDKARLTVDDEYNSSLDYILFTALIMEMKRKDHELAFGRRAEPHARARAYSASADAGHAPPHKTTPTARRRVGTI